MQQPNLLVLISVAILAVAIPGAIIVVLLVRASNRTVAQQNGSATQAPMERANAGVARTGSGEGKGMSKAPGLSPEEQAKREEMLQRTHLPGSPTPDVR